MINLFYFASARLLLLVTLLAGMALTGLAETKKPDPKALPNFQEVTTNTYRGGAPTREGLRTLQKMGVHTIIDLRIEKKAQGEKKVAEEMGFTWIHLPMGREAPTKKQVDTFLATLANAEDEPVFVHCQHGADRTGCMIGIYRVQVQGWTFEQAWKEMRKYGFKPYLDELKAAVRSRAKK
jgi:protein tyrosine/serine phosphatase